MTTIAGKTESQGEIEVVIQNKRTGQIKYHETMDVVFVRLTWRQKIMNWILSLIRR